MRQRRWLPILLLAAGLLFGPISARAAAEPVDVTVTIPEPPGTGSVQVTNAQFRWGLNQEAGSGAFFGGCNFLSAGKAGNSNGSRLWTDADNGSLFRATDGAVRVEKPVGSTYRELAWADRCLNAEGAPVTTTSLTGTGVQAVIDGGTCFVDTAGGSARISWQGSFTVVFYGGLTYWWLSDPVLTVNPDGTGVVTATAGGFGSDREDTSRWTALPETSVVVANLRGVTLALEGFTTDPLYREVAITLPPDATAQNREGPAWGAFPQTFVDFQHTTGQASYWYSTGGLRDAAKVATRVFISYDATAPINNTGNQVPTAGGNDLPDLTGSSAGGPGGGADLGFSSAPGGSLANPVGTGLPNTGAPAITQAAPATNFTPIAATTVLPGGGLIPDYVKSSGWAPLLWSTSILLLLGSLAWVGFRRGWLQLPFRAPKNPTPSN